MATKNRIKGISLEIGGDTSGLSKALSGLDRQTADIQSELREVEKLLKLDPKSTELLTQKQTLLGKQLDNTKDRLEALKKAEKAAQDQFEKGEIAEDQYRALQREIIKTTNSVEALEKAQTESNKKSTKSFTDLKKGFTVATAGATAFVAAVTAIANKLSEVEENTREYREDLNRLDTAYKVSGKTIEDARKSYSDFYAILGEEDRSVEAVNHLAELCDNQEELAKWSDICAGVSAKFGDSLPIEGLTEASNETAKVGAVTGVLADALNWAGIKEDEFNEKLNQCSSEQERSKLITETLNATYSSSAEMFKTMNASIIETRKSTQKMTDAQAELGEAVAPIKAKITSAMAEVVSGFANIVSEMTNTQSESDKLVEKLDDQNEAWKNLKDTQEAKTQAAVAEIDYTKRLG